MEKNIKFYQWWATASENTPRKIEDIVGKTPINISVDDSGYDQDEIVFLFDDGTACKFSHEQSCCESVYIEDVNGDWDDLIGTPLLVAEERVPLGDDLPPLDRWAKSYTWTFYTFRSIKGSVDVRWYGESNGYYSEEVDFYGVILES